MVVSLTHIAYLLGIAENNFIVVVPLVCLRSSLMVRKSRVQAEQVPSEAAPASLASRRGGRAKRNTAVPRSRSTRISTVQEKDDGHGEEFDIDAELAKQGADSETDEDSDEVPRARSGPTDPSRPSRTAVYDPFVDPARTQSTKTASTADVQYFFERTEDCSTCKLCRYVSPLHRNM